MPETTGNAADAARELTALLDEWETYGGRLIPIGEHHIDVAKLRTLAGVALTLTEAAAELADPAEFGIVALHACDIRATWIQVHHVPCAEVVFGGTDDAEDTNAGELLERMAAHRCDAVAEPRDVSQIIHVDTTDGGGTVTAVVHGSRRLDDEEQDAMAEILRATRKLEREKRREAARQRDEDVRAVDRLLRELHGRSGVDALKAVTRLQERFGDRIEELRRRDAGAEGTVSGG